MPEAKLPVPPISYEAVVAELQFMGNPASPSPKVSEMSDREFKMHMRRKQLEIWKLQWGNLAMDVRLKWMDEER